MKLLAHITQDDGRRIEQSLQSHCINTARYAAESLRDMNLYYTAYLAGILHDMGKAREMYVQYLENAYAGAKAERGTVNHTFAGCIYIMEKHHKDTSPPFEKLTSEIIGYSIGAHHGLFDCADLDGKNGFEHRLQKNRAELCYEDVIQNYFSHVVNESETEIYFEKSVQEIQSFMNAARETYNSSLKKVYFQISLLIRMVSSAVIYGDRRDTYEFMNQKTSDLYPGIDWKSQKNFFEDKISEFSSGSGINQVRSEISDQCQKFADEPCSIYRLNVPTGGGKTLSALRYALTHAEKYNKKRIIFIVPLLSVLDQNVKVIREYMQDDTCILEHHSNVVRETEDEEKLDRYELLTDGWDSPVIVSTLVQLLNILFAHQTSAVRRMQALCSSIIVIDEVQSLPKKTVAMFNMAMNFLQQFCNTTIVLSSATQPCLELVKWPLHLAQEPDMVGLNPEQLQVFKRADIIDRTNSCGMDWDECCEYCCELMERHVSLLLICNTKAEARILYEKMQQIADIQDWDLHHLSTAMCQRHRRDELKQIQDRLKTIQSRVRQGKPVRRLLCISTQVVEAGIDFSFEGVIRVLAGVDNLAQAAGRCNRSNEYGHTGTVYLINLKNENLSMLKDIAAAQNCTRKVIQDQKRFGDESLIGEYATRNFYQYLFAVDEAEIKYPIADYGKTYYLADLLGNNNPVVSKKDLRNYLLHQPFRKVGNSFRVFEDDTVDILVPYRDGKDLIDQLKKIQSAFSWEETNKLICQAKQYSVSVFRQQRDKLDDAGMLSSVLDGRVLVLDEKAYHDKCGLVQIREQPVENYIL